VILKPFIFLLLAFLLLVFAYIVFRRMVRRKYETRSRLGGLASTLQLLVFVGYFSFPYLYNPPEWPWFWRVNSSLPRVLHLTGFAVICTGFLVAFGTMAWFGIGKAFGLDVGGLTKHGLYRFSRNPQILGGYLLVIGTSLQWLSVYSLGWIMMYGIISHWMVITEEEHLARVYSKEYEAYCSEVPRYFPRPRRE
jgi:protein-S-isoprenylcysteine O-methyltransferase Ste14